MKDNMRGAAAIVGIGELKPERTRAGPRCDELAG